jgi:hypothetical protein
LNSCLSTTIVLVAHYYNALFPTVETGKAEICDMHRNGAVIAVQGYAYIGTSLHAKPCLCPF